MTTTPIETEHDAILPSTSEGMASVIHDLGNFIQIAVSAISLALRHSDVGATSEPGIMIAHAKDSLERAGALVHRAMGRQLAIEDEEVSVNECIGQIGPLLRYVCGSGIRIKLRLGFLPKIRSSRLGLQRAVLNLALNARDAMPDGGTLTVVSRLAEGPEAPAVEVLVADSGIGMSTAALAQAVEPNFSTKPPGSGSGMGLPGVRAFVEQSNGRLFIASTPGAGTSVTLRLPTLT